MAVRPQIRLRSLLALVMTIALAMAAVNRALRPRPEVPCVYVQGDAVVPGRQQFFDGLTAWSAIKAAGGLAPRADKQNICLVRDKSKVPVAPVDLDDPSTNYKLMPGDRIVIYRVANFRDGGRSKGPEK